MIMQDPVSAINIPDVDVWQLLFEQPKEFSRHKSTAKTLQLFSDPDLKLTTSQTFTSTMPPLPPTVSRMSSNKRSNLVFASNSIEIPAVIWGTHYCGGTVFPMNPAYTAKELTRQLLLSKTKAICTQRNFLPTVREAALEAGVSQAMTLIGPDESAGTNSLHDMLTLDVAPVPRLPVTSPEQDLAFLVFLSGTTGMPKAVKATHRNVVSNILMLKAAETEISHDSGSQREGDRLLALLPFFHILDLSSLSESRLIMLTGLMAVVHSSIYNGLQVVVMEQFRLKAFCQAVRHHRITYIHVVPLIILQLAKSTIADRYDLSSIRMLVSAAAPLSTELVHNLWERRSIRVIQGYGLSETCAGTRMQLLLNMQARVVSAEGLDVPTGEQDELWLKGATVFSCYLNDPKSTSECFSADGFFMTGDIVVKDSDGYFNILDRIKELIKYKGFQVAPAELEGILMCHPLAADVCVIGVDDERQATQVPMACISLDAIKRWYDAKVSNAKRLRGGIVMVDEISKSAAGKTLHRVLEECVLASIKLKAKL
ncbi:acetyl-CoA synthetase-like protein [Aureobasidium pullulans]|nr:acetyl-CoA synthetase-like protein [Aureobasidium pullulans]